MEKPILVAQSRSALKEFALALARKCFLPQHRVVLRLLVTEIKISFYHRKGLAKVRRMSALPANLNLGAGDLCKSGYLNIDLFPGGDLTLDLRRELPFKSDSCDMIFSEHFFEHLDYPTGISRLLGECLRVLRPGGILSFSVPDTEWPLLDYQHGLQAPYFRAMEEFQWHPGCTTRLEHINYHFRQHGQHLFAYDEETARKLLQIVGFVNITKRQYQRDLDSERRRVGSLFMSAQKPGEL
jgi:predicted SAM-dependent methyltransferase